MSASDLGKLVKQKYPGSYDSISDDQLGQQVASKYPQYQSYISGVGQPAQPTAQQPGQPVAQPQSAWDKIKGYVSGTAPGKLYSDVTSNISAGQDTSNANKVSSSLSGLNDALKAELAKTTDPAKRKKLQDSITANMGTQSQQYKSVGSNPQYNKSTESGMGDLAGTVADAATFATGGASSVGKIAASTAGGALFGAAQGLTADKSTKGVATDTAKYAALSALLSGLMEGGSKANQVIKKLVGKTDMGNLFQNPNIDAVKGLLGKDSGNYKALLNTANDAASSGIETHPIVSSVNKILTDTTDGFSIKGAGPAGLTSIHPEDQAVMQKVVDYANGNLTFKNPKELQKVLEDAGQVAQGYGLDVKLPGTSVQQDITKGISDAFSVRKYRGAKLPDPNEIAKAMSGSFKSVLDNNGHIPLDFGSSVFKTDPAKQKIINEVWSDVGSTVKSDNSVKGLDKLKQRIDGNYVLNPSTKADKTLNAFLTATRNAIQDPLKAASPEYGKAMQSAQSNIIGKKYSKIFPSNVTSGSIGALAAYLHNPAFLGAEVAASPFARGATAVAAGAANKAIGTATVPVAQATKNSPTAMAALLKLLGL